MSGVAKTWLDVVFTLRARQIQQAYEPGLSSTVQHARKKTCDGTARTQQSID